MTESEAKYITYRDIGLMIISACIMVITFHSINYI